MSNRFQTKRLLSVFGCCVALVLALRASTQPHATLAEPTTNAIEKAAVQIHALTPGADDGQIAYRTALMLEHVQYLRKPFDSTVSSKFLDRYLDYLDSAHIHFLQSDLAQFEEYRYELQRLTLREKDAKAATAIFNRFVQRLQEHVDYVDQMLSKEKFTFDTEDRVLLNRKEAPYPKDLQEAQKLWRDRLRYEYLQEKLGRIGGKKTEHASDKAAHADSTKAGAAANSPAKTEDQEIADLLKHRYHRTLRTFTDFNNEDVLQVYLSALTHVYDPHSDYFNRALLEQFSIGMNLTLFGIGAELQTTEDGYCMIRRVLPGGPAEKSKKIKEKDRIVAVAQSNQPPVDIIDMNLNKAVQLIRGPKGTEVRLTVQPEDGGASSRYVLPLVRDEIPLEDSAAKGSIIEWPDASGQMQRLGVINLPSFYAPFNPANSRDRTEATNTPSADVARLLRKMEKEKVQGVILDLRNNGGGSLEEAIKVTGLFVKEEPVVQVKDFRGGIEVQRAEDPAPVYDGPLVVLTSRFSASASEIVAGALQDYGRALLIGDSSTHGKGTVQSVNTVQSAGYIMPQLPPWQFTNDPGAVKLTIKKFYRASGVSTQKRGVIPDMVLPSIWNDSKDIGETALENPLECDSIPSAKYDHLNRVEAYLPELTKRSKARVALDPEFGYVMQDIALLKKAQADKTVSLNMKERLTEKEETEARNKARDKERLARKELPEIVHPLTLKQVDEPGLPPALLHTNSIAKVSNAKGTALPGVSTNSALASGSPTVPSGEAEEEKPPAFDATLEEAEHILVDYMEALKKRNIASNAQAVGHPE